MERAMSIPGHVLTYVPDEVLQWEDKEARACCAAVECFGLCYLCDTQCAIPTMGYFEDGLNKRSLPLFAFYEVCWPCMWIAKYCFGMSRERARELPREYISHLKVNTFDSDEVAPQ